MKSISWITKVMTLSLMLVTIVPLASDTMTTASAAIHDELENKKAELTQKLQILMSYHYEFGRLLNKNFTEDETPELYTFLYNYADQLNYVYNLLQQATTMEELSEPQVLLDKLEVEFPNDMKEALRIRFQHIAESIARLENELSEKAGEDEAPELYEQLNNLEADFNRMYSFLDQATTIDDLFSIFERIVDFQEALVWMTCEIEDNYYVVSETIEGIKMRFRIINEEEKTVEVLGIRYYEYGGTVTIPENVNGYTVIGIADRAFHEKRIGTVVIPPTITSIGSEEFYGNNYMSKIVIFDLSAWINIKFSSSNWSSEYGYRLYLDDEEIKNLIIPSSITSIGNYVFQNCKSLTSVTVDSKTPIAISWSTFDNRSNMTLYVPAGSKAAYEQADYWKDFKEIIELPAPYSYDVDGNGEVNANDVNSLVDKILDQVSVADDKNFAYDVNQDGEVNIADVTLLVNRINYLERVTTLESGSADEVRTVLEQMSGTLQTDAREVASVIKENPNVEDAYTEDGDNLIVKHKDSDEVVVYPMYKMMAPFSDLQVPELPSQTTMLRAPRKAVKQYPKVAIFNFFEDMSPYKVQNLITRSVEKYFLTNGYDVDYYTPNNVRDEYMFTYDNLASVLYQSKNYAAIIIMTHGAQVNGGNYLCTGEVAGRNDRNMYNWADDKYYKMYSADLQAESNCILYLGICDSRKNNGFDSMSPTIGYSGPTCMAQANAAMLFYLMLEEGYSLEEALSVLPSEPSPNEKTKVCKSNNVGSQMLESETYQNREYMQDCSVDYLLRNNGDYSYAGGVFTANDDKMPFFAWVEFVPILWYDVNWQEDFYDYLPHLKHPANVENGAFSADFNLRKLPESIYICRITGLTKSKEKKLIKPSKYRFRICSQNFKENSADVNTSDESITAPLILDADGKVVDEITLAAGSSATFTLEAYSGHTFETPCLDTNVATVSLSGTTLTVTGVAVGTTYFGVYNVQNRQTAVVMVTVMPSTNPQAYFFCPDDHHPHLIDLGLPSGTKWACCNVGASKPEDYGDYFAWGETTGYNGGKTNFDWSTYKWCKGTNRTMTKYCTSSDYGYEGFTDNKTELDLDDDAAYVNWGPAWRMPSIEQYEELLNSSYTTAEWTTQNGVNGRKITSKMAGYEGNFIFLPLAGCRIVNRLDEVGDNGWYWSRTLDTSRPELAWYHPSFNWTPENAFSFLRFNGQSVRPVLFSE